MSEYLPKAKDDIFHEGDEPLPEALFWLLVTGDIPTPHEYEEIMDELSKRGGLERDLKDFIDNLPEKMSLMTQLSSSLLYLQPNSFCQKALVDGVPHERMWEYVYEDALNILAKLPYIISYLYKKQYKKNGTVDGNPELDWSANLTHMLGFENNDLKEYMRAYLTVYA